ncbi:DNA primase [Arcticibacter svalbardensis MN12-7]|uniref:DNA primase n=1 Tax=Arcticibacter svalbardensis MN12-7 TaxID=1150600 RepID=R9GWV5_9SPHI|nr:DNA primase [Arcticibacter svalbardensis]EOR96005.1 DNA primase [Arcticibacter svalbardensis MN12-7]
MIPKETVDKILETARIDEVVGDFVALKKRGTSLIGLCPFHNESTPSFHVSVPKGIFKCFGCGKGGDSTRFIMDHEKYSYPEALKYLANKYQIEIAEEVQSPERQEADLRREGLYVVTTRAARFFQDSMWTSQEGQTIGLGYYKERGFRDEVLKKFELGYSPDSWDAFITKALQEGFNEKILEDAGLAIRNDKGKLYDRFRGRVLFPIHSFTGRIIGFGGRTLKTDKKVPKYVNSPESEIYHKSDVLYGLYFAKKAIRDADNCYLVEGYADVLSVHQAGIENVVASSGTSLTTAQIRLIGRFTKNITILYDGDPAGIKASLRGLDMILEEGLNVRVVLFPDGHDPDSYVRKLGSSEFKNYIEKNQKDFILYKTTILLKYAGTDPIKKAGVIREVVESIAKIPDSIKASVFIRECSTLMQIDERALITELNKLKQGKYKAPRQDEPDPLPPPDGMEYADIPSILAQVQEQEVVRLLLNYGHELVNWDGVTDTYIAPYAISNMADVTFEDPVCKLIIDEYAKRIDDGELPTVQDFIQSRDQRIADMAISLVTSPYVLSDNWYDKRKIFVRNETENMRATILGGIFHLKKRKVEEILKNIREEIQKEVDEDNMTILLQRYMRVKEVEKGISAFLGSVVVK